jgi:hypothetical protein
LSIGIERWSIVAGVLTLVSSAAAQPAPAKEGAARSLFDEGRKLFADGHVGEACEKFAASYTIEKKTSTLFNLATCHERDGKIATAWLEFSEARTRAEQESQPERAKLAGERATVLAPQVPHLRLVFTERAPGLVVRLDGAPVPSAALDAQIPVDPGAHTIEFSAEARRSRRQEVAVAPAKTVAVEVPVLERGETPAVRPVPEERSAEKPRSSPTLGWVLLGVGGASAVAGGIFGARAFGQRQDAEDAAVAGRASAARTENDAGITSAWIANVALGAALVTVAVGTYLLLTRDGSTRGPAPPR